MYQIVEVWNMFGLHKVLLVAAFIATAIVFAFIWVVHVLCDIQLSDSWRKVKTSNQKAGLIIFLGFMLACVSYAVTWWAADQYGVLLGPPIINQ